MDKLVNFWTILGGVASLLSISVQSADLKPPVRRQLAQSILNFGFGREQVRTALSIFLNYFSILFGQGRRIDVAAALTISAITIATFISFFAVWYFGLQGGTLSGFTSPLVKNALHDTFIYAMPLAICIDRAGLGNSDRAISGFPA